LLEFISIVVDFLFCGWEVFSIEGDWDLGSFGSEGNADIESFNITSSVENNISVEFDVNTNSGWLWGVDSCFLIVELLGIAF
jgi:hypothetical protein